MGTPDVAELVIWWAPLAGTAQERFFDDDTQDGNLLMQGGWASGKTMTLTAKMLKLSAINAPLMGLWTVPHYGHIHQTILPMLESEDPKTGHRWFLEDGQFHYHEQRHVLTWDGGGPIQFLSAENAEAIAGPNMAFCGTDEPGTISHKAWRNTTARVRHPQATLRQKVAAGTPEGVTYLVEYFGPDRSDKFRLYEMSTIENVELMRANPEYLSQAMTHMTPAEIAAYLGGKAVNVSGALAYPTFDPDLHWSENVMAANPAWPLVLTFDFNVDPMVCPIGQAVSGPYGLEPHVVDMVTLYGGSTVDQTCDAVLERYPQWRAGFVVYGDSTGASRHVQSLRSNYDLIRERLSVAGPVTVKVPSANPPVARRLNSVNRMFKDGQGRVRCYIRKTQPANRCATKPLVTSLLQTLRKPGTDDLWKKPGETVTHAADALGYWIDYEWPAQKPQTVSAVIQVPQDGRAGTSLTMAALRARKQAAVWQEIGGRG